MDPFWRASLLFFTTLVYLFIGAGIFSVLEGHYEEVAKVNINKTVEDFLAKHKDVTFGELMDVLHEIRKSDDMGVSSDDVIAGTYHNRWDVVNAFYFCVTTITTIGFGHLSPSTVGGKIVFAFYALFGIPLMAWFLIEAATLMKERILIISQKIQNGLSHCIRSHFLRMFITMVIFIVFSYVILLVIPAAIIASIEGWSNSDAQYFCFVAITTIGFGDYITTEQTTGWVEWIYKLATTMYFLNSMVILLAVACIIYEQRPAPKTVTHERMTTNNGGQTALEEQMGDAEERELSLGHLALQGADIDDAHVEVTVDDNHEDSDDYDPETPRGDGKYQKL